MRDRYWHNMAARIQRAWRNFIRYRIECATRIQRFWRRKKDGIEFARVRQKGHDLLAGRKERRRYSLLSYRRFAGDYLDVGGKGSGGQQLRAAAGLSGAESVLFSCRVELLKSSFGRSSKPSPRFLIVTNSAAYFLIATAAGGSIVTSVERKLPLVTIRSVAVSNLRDDWLTFNTTASEEGDPVFTCVFKTELITHMHTASGGSLQVLIGPTIDYAKKKDKRALITFRKDPSNPRLDVYKSHVVSVGQGEPANSVTRPMARPKPGVVRPITAGKLLRKGGPSKPHPSAGRLPQTASLPGKVASATPKSGGMSYETSASAPKAAAAPVAVAAARPTPPPPPRAGGPPPPPPGRPEVPRYRSLYNFDGQEGEMNLRKEDVVEVKEKDDNGWWLVTKGGKEGWAPSNYLELIPQAKPAAPPPPPPGRRAPPSAPAAKPTPAPAAAASTGGFNGAAIANAAASLRSSGTPASSPMSSRPGSGMGAGPPVLKPKPPVLAPKPGAPPLAPKPPASAGIPAGLGRTPPAPPAPPAAAAASGGARKPPIPKAPVGLGAPVGGGAGGGSTGGTKLKLSALGGGTGKPGGGIQAMDLQAALMKKTGRPVID
jgi:myosin-1